MSILQNYLNNTDVNSKINEFISSLRSGFYNVKDIVPNELVDTEIKRFHSLLSALSELDSENSQFEDDIASIISNKPLFLEFVQLILSLPATVGFVDGRKFNTVSPKNHQNSIDLARLIRDMGFWNVIGSNSNYSDLLRVAIIAKYAKKRPYTANKNKEKVISSTILTAVDKVKSEVNKNIGFIPKYKLGRAYPQVKYLIGVEDNPICAIDTVLITNPGGSQSYDLKYTYPGLQNLLSEKSTQLILILDGIGINQIPRSVLEILFNSVYVVMSTKQAEEGFLQAAITSAIDVKPQITIPVERIIESSLMSGNTVSTQSLPVSVDQARIALAGYATKNEQYALSLSSGGETLSWSRKVLFERTFPLINSFDEESAVQIFNDLIGANSIFDESINGEIGRSIVLSIDANPVLPSKFLVTAVNAEKSIDLLRNVSRHSLQKVPQAKLSVLILPYTEKESDSKEFNRLQSRLHTNVITIYLNQLLDFIKGAKNPRNAFLSEVLEQADLTKISPFVVNSVTPNRIFYGREREEATLINTLLTNSVAVLGSRRIGKTSLLRHVETSLRDADFIVFFLDCQTVGNWQHFGEMVQREWNVQIPHPEKFEPDDLFDIVYQLKNKSNKHLVILLDEIDQLLFWDMIQEKDSVPEAFFRSCRTISQQGEAQFVFSGERTIANKLWDPHSPHWNFCRPLLLKQLDRDSTEKLLLQPLESLQISIPDVEVFKTVCWRVTTGHPQIAQFLGDKLVQNLNGHEPIQRANLTQQDIDNVINSFEFKEHYLTTYWGQATPLEKLISLLIIKEEKSPAEIIQVLEFLALTENEVLDSLRMLDLYGIVEQKNNVYKLKTNWFYEALRAYGGYEETLKRAWEKIK